MKPCTISTLIAYTIVGASVLSSTGCASDFVADPSRPRPTRAVQDPMETNSPASEARAGTSQGVPIVNVDLPNKEGQTPQVRTVADNIHDTFNPPASAGTASGATTTPSSTVHIDPIQGRRE
jgi:hypothetical protein